jgi:signal peptidase I
MTPVSSSPSHVTGRSALRAVLRAERALWVAVIPALLAIVTVRFLIPLPSPALAPPLLALVQAGQSFPLVAGAGLFVLFSLLAQYWRAHLPGDLSLALAVPAARKAPSRFRQWLEIASVPAAVALAVGVALAARATLGEPYRVLTASMLPTLQPGVQVMGNKRAYKPGELPRRGDVIAFRSSAVALSHGTAAPPVMMKRVIGLPGDRIQMHGGTAFINGWAVPTCDAGEYGYLLPDGQGGAVRGRLLVEFLDERAYLTVQMPTNAFPGVYEVQPGEVFVLGDNRGTSLDSRSWNDGHGGGAPLTAIDARVDRFLVGVHLDGRADWSRILRPVTPDRPLLWVEGYDASSAEAGISKCLNEAPSVTRPPPPGGPLAPMTPSIQGGI